MKNTLVGRDLIKEWVNDLRISKECIKSPSTEISRGKYAGKKNEDIANISLRFIRHRNYS